MSHPFRPEAGGPSDIKRARRRLQLESIDPLEGRQLLAPYIPTSNLTAAFTAAATPTNANLGTVVINSTTADTLSAAAYTSVSQFTPLSSFGGNIVRIQAGPGGDFGKGVYAVTRGAGDNAGQPGVVSRPGVIYRSDPVTGKSSVFFDLNSVISQVSPGATAANSLLPSTGLINWYDIAFDPEGVFDGKPSVFVTSADLSDPSKNAVFRIGPDGSFLGAFVAFNGAGGSASGPFDRAPTAVLVPPPEQQKFLKGLFVGDGNGKATASPTAGNVAPTGARAAVPNGNAVLFFDANAFRPGQKVNLTNLPAGATSSGLTLGPQTSINASNTSYNSPVYSTFADFGSPALATLIPAVPGLSGVQGLGGELLIGGGRVAAGFADPNSNTPDLNGAITTPFRRFEDSAFDYYGYFSYGTTVTAGVNGANATVGAPTFAGSEFVADLATGLAVNVTSQAITIGVAPNQTIIPATGISVPIQGPGSVGVQLTPPGTVTGLLQPITTGGNTTGGTNLGGRIIRITPAGVINVFAQGFRTSGNQDASSLANSSLSITFSADGTILYAADDDGIWQFKTVTSLADSTSGQLIGLGDIRSLGVPYEGQDSAVAILDTGVDAQTPNFRGRVSPGTNVTLNVNATHGATTGTALGNDDTVSSATPNGHGTLVAGVVAQFVPQATIEPINIFTANAAAPNNSTNDLLYNGLGYTASNPFVADPVRVNTQDRVIAANLGFGTTRTFQTEAQAYKSYSQIVIAFKNQMARLRGLGIQPIAAAGQFGNNGSIDPNGATFGSFDGISLPAVLNEVISVTGSYSFPFANSSTSTPDDPGSGVYPRPLGPVLAISNLGGVGNAGLQILGNAATITAADALIFKDKILNSVNRNVVTDFTAPAVNVPTFRRTFAGDGLSYNVFTEGGTSLSAAQVTGSYAVVASALDYWTGISKNGVTVDGYLATKAGVRQLDFGANQLYNLSPYATPDGINSILQWTAVPAVDAPTSAEAIVSNQPTLFGGTNYREISRVDVGNAVAAIEATEALRYLFAHNDIPLIDANKNGIITAAEVQAFVDQATQVGQPEAAAMASLLGGTARTGNADVRLVGAGLSLPVGAGAVSINGTTITGDQPDQPDVLQRRFNLLDYSADGILNGGVTIDQLKTLVHTLLPTPDAFVVTDRARSSNNGYLVDARPLRNYHDLQHLVPSYVFVPKSAVKRFKGISPAKFGVNKKLPPALQSPTYTLFSPTPAKATKPKATLAASTGATTAAPKPAATMPAATTPAAATATNPTPTTSPIAAASAPSSAPGATNPIVSALTSLAGARPATTVPGTNDLATTQVSTPRPVAGTPAATSAGGTATSTPTSTATAPTAAAPLAKVAAKPDATKPVHKDVWQRIGDSFKGLIGK